MSMSSAGLLSRPLPRDRNLSTEAWPAQFRPVLTKLVAGRRKYFGADEISVEPLTQIERPYSTLLQIRVGTGGCAQGAFVKILKPRADTPAEIASMQRNVQRDFEMTARVRHALGRCAGPDGSAADCVFPGRTDHRDRRSRRADAVGSPGAASGRLAAAVGRSRAFPTLVSRRSVVEGGAGRPPGRSPARSRSDANLP